MKKTRLGDTLLQYKVITTDQLHSIQREIKLNGGTFSSYVVLNDIMSYLELAHFVGRHFKRPIVDISVMDIDKSMTDIPMDLMRKHRLIPISQKGRTITVASSDPYDLQAFDDIGFVSNSNIDIVIAQEDHIIAKLDSMTDEEDALANVMSELGAEEFEVVDTSDQDIDNINLAASTEEAPVIRLVNLILADAIKQGASDIHVEPYEKELRVRYRIDGVLQDMMKPPLQMQQAIVSRIKIQARLDISERRMPQDGRIKLKLSKKKSVDFRVSVLPTLFGEKVVMRLLDADNLQLDMRMLGFEEEDLKKLQYHIHQPYGMVLVTGPTGSGKTVSLYSSVAEINTSNVNICTAEDPVEFNFKGINQVNVNEKIGLTFPVALKSFLRQDPDVILIGEIRDHDTASIGIKAALTGHLVLATLHTNDAPSTMTRLVNMGMESFLVGSAVNLVVAQRLARKNCKDCVEDINIPDEALIDAGVKELDLEHMHTKKGAGCKTCNGTGFKGRIGIYQVMPVSEEIRDAIYRGDNSDTINDIAVSQGVNTLRMAALRKVKAGELALEECLRVTTAD